MLFYFMLDCDDGYDVSDFYGIDFWCGDYGDFVEVICIVRDCGICVIVDFVINYILDWYFWFFVVKCSVFFLYCDYYVWWDDVLLKGQQNVVFFGQVDGIWMKDEVLGQWYQYSFYEYQFDFNIVNFVVWDEIVKVIGFWLQLGVLGFWVDVVLFFFEVFCGVEIFDFYEFLCDIWWFFQW